MLWLADIEHPGIIRRRERRAVVAIAVGAILLLQDVGAGLPSTLALPALLAAVGAALVWGGGSTRRARPLWLALGMTLIVLGGASVLAVTGELRTLGRSAAAAAVVLLGASLVAGPWLSRLARDLTEERRQRIRSQERAEVATHLHDGVLQTLALIQKRAGDDREVRSLARHQERELRAWLYGMPGSAGGPDTVAAMLRRELADLEDRYGVRLDAILVGDAPLDEAGRALVGAGREAALNAARHAGVDAVDVYLEAEPERLSLFVRDRGRGFDPDDVPSDRRGLTDSVRARVRRHGGTAEVRSAPGEGTEVEISVPRGDG
jgi:signal transduction histidine kinase